MLPLLQTRATYSIKGTGVELYWGSSYGLAHGFLAALGDRGCGGANRSGSGNITVREIDHPLQRVL